VKLSDQLLLDEAVSEAGKPLRIIALARLGKKPDALAELRCAEVVFPGVY